jgi:hypothetical protein
VRGVCLASSVVRLTPDYEGHVARPTVSKGNRSSGLKSVGSLWCEMDQSGRVTEWTLEAGRDIERSYSMGLPQPCRLAHHRPRKRGSAPGSLTLPTSPHLPFSYVGQVAPRPLC